MPICLNCGAHFDPTRRLPQKFCNNKCRSNYHNDKNRGYTEEVKEIEIKRAELEKLQNSLPQILKCPHCNTTTEMPGMLEIVSEGMYYCNTCSKISKLVLK